MPPERHDQCPARLECGERLARIETKLDDGFGRLFGNGQPGVVEKHESRIGALERWQWHILGGAVAAWALAGWLAPAIKAALK